MTDTFGPAKSCKPILQLWHPRELANEQLIQVMVKIWERGLWKKTTNKMHRKHKILMLSLVGLGLIYVFGLAFPIYNFFSTVFWRLQYFKWVKLQSHEEVFVCKTNIVFPLAFCTPSQEMKKWQFWVLFVFPWCSMQYTAVSSFFPSFSCLPSWFKLFWPSFTSLAEYSNQRKEEMHEKKSIQLLRSKEKLYCQEKSFLIYAGFFSVSEAQDTILSIWKALSPRPLLCSPPTISSKLVGGWDMR